MGHLQNYSTRMQESHLPRYGKKYADESAEEHASSLYAISQRQTVFPIPEELRKALGADHALFKAMMDA